MKKLFFSFLIGLVVLPHYVFAITINEINPDNILTKEIITESVCLKSETILQDYTSNSPTGTFDNKISAEKPTYEKCLDWGEKEYYEYYYKTEKTINVIPYQNNHYATRINKNTVAFYAKPVWSWGTDGTIKEVKTATTSFATFNEATSLTKLDIFRSWFIDTVFATTTVTSTQKYTPPCAGNASILVVAGGGGGGAGRSGGGGGGGGYQYYATYTLKAQEYNVTVGTGGAGGIFGSSKGTNGGNSVFDTITATGGGGGGSYNSPSTNNINGVNGGCGGGGAETTSLGTAGTGSQGGNGGIAYYGANDQGGGGGGASANGTDGTVTASGGNGGNGTANSITGTSVTYAGGGGGGADASGSGGNGGSGGGGIGGGYHTENLNPEAGTDGLGGGGGGGGFKDSGAVQNNGADGGDGVVIISFDETQCAEEPPTPTSTLATTTLSAFDSNNLFVIGIGILILVILGILDFIRRVFHLGTKN